MGSESDSSSNEVLFISSRRDDDHAVVELEGELDPYGSDRLAAEVQNLLMRPVKILDIDATRLTFADSAGLRALLLARSAAENVGATFRVIGVSPPVARVIELAGLSEHLLPTEPDPA